ncbi:hypothetical protein ACROYT_G012348 [Oculina patagonica]
MLAGGVPPALQFRRAVHRSALPPALLAGNTTSQRYSSKTLQNDLRWGQRTKNATWKQVTSGLCLSIVMTIKDVQTIKVQSFLCLTRLDAQKYVCSMEELKKKYILLHDHIKPTQVLRGDLLEALPEAKQSLDSTKITVLARINRYPFQLRLECSTEDLAQLSDEDANLLVAISAAQLRYETFIDKKRLDFGRRLSPESDVFVSVKGVSGVSQDLPGVVRYKGKILFTAGTMFGVELIWDFDLNAPKADHHAQVACEQAPDDVFGERSEPSNVSGRDRKSGEPADKAFLPPFRARDSSATSD